MRENFKKKILNNGMSILFEKRDLPIISIAFAVKYGGVNESLNEKGIAHFIEHMVFKGTKNRTCLEISQALEGVGGEINAATDENVTFYFAKLPSEHLFLGLDVLSDLVKNPVFDEKELEKERKVIFEEMKMNRDSPIRYSVDQIQGILYTGDFSERLIGTEETLSTINRDKILEKFNQVYKPENMVLCVVGDADFDSLVNFAEENFDPGKVNLPKTEFDFKNESKKEKRKGIDQSNIIFCYHTPFAGDKKSYAARALLKYLTGGLSSKLFEEIREKRNLAYAIKGGSEIAKNFSHSFIYVGTTKNNIEKVKEILLEEYKNISENFSENDLEKIKTKMKGNFKISTEDSSDQMINLLYSELGSSAEEFYDFEKNISEIKIEDIKEIARKAYENHSFFVLEPEDS